MSKPQTGEPFECLSIPVEIEKEIQKNENGENKLDESGKPVYYCGFSVAGGIDQDFKLSPQGYTDNGIYVTAIKQNGPASKSNLKVNDKILQVNGYDFTLVTHKKAVEYLKKGTSLNMLVSRDHQQQAKSTTTSVS